LIQIGQAVLAFNGTVDYFIDSVFNYPTLAECYKVAALNGANKLRALRPGGVGAGPSPAPTERNPEGTDARALALLYTTAS
jgi:hypothetical protein